MRYVKYWMALLLVGVLAACGGGGGSAGGTSGGGTGGSTGGTTGTPTLTVAIANSANVIVNSIAAGGGFVVRATVKNAAGEPVAGRLVTFSAGDSGIALVTPTTALTNASGVAEVAIAPTSLSAVGASTLTATSTVDATSLTASSDYAVSASSLALSPLSIASSSLASGGNTTLATTASVAGVPSAGVPVNVSFAASCGRINGQDTTGGGVSVTTNGNGVASASYAAVSMDGSLCSGAVTVTASSAGAASQSGVVTVAAPVANAVTFVSATPEQIFIAGAGATEQSVVTFRVLSSVGTALAGVNVQFSIETNPGGVGIGSSGSTLSVPATSDQDGRVSVALFSGTIPGPVKLRAALTSAPTVFAESQNLTVASGPPSQRFMSLSVERFNIEGAARDGTSTALTVRIADRQGNAVQDGTVVNFTAEGGQVARSCATSRVDGISLCSVTFVTQNPKPLNGRVSVLAYLSGTKDYVDVNGNNRYDDGPQNLVQQGDAFRDDNENLLAEDGEFVVPRNGGLACPVLTDGSVPYKANTCDLELGTTVRQQAIILFAASTAAAPQYLEVSPSKVRFLLFGAAAAGQPRLPMPAGTTITATSPQTGCTVTSTLGSPVAIVRPRPGVPNESLETEVTLLLTGCGSANTLSIRITTPSGEVTTLPAITL
jgi:hypothetical protein